MADIAASVLEKLKNKAKASGISYQQCLQLFFQEEFLRRLAGSKYAENFVLKGGLSARKIRHTAMPISHKTANRNAAPLPFPVPNSCTSRPSVCVAMMGSKT